MSILLQKTDLSDILSNIKQRNLKDNWIAWIHEGYRTYKVNPKQSIEMYLEELTMERSDNKAKIMETCCNFCIALNSCHFAEWNMPTNPILNNPGLLHPNCHCTKMPIAKPIANVTAFAECHACKFTKYATELDKSKKEIYEKLGYDVTKDAEYLRNELSRQALQKYINGEYELRELKTDGQTIRIAINLNGQSFWTGWVINPNGWIVNKTPFTGWIKKGYK